MKHQNDKIMVHVSTLRTIYLWYSKVLLLRPLNKLDLSAIKTIYFRLKKLFSMYLVSIAI